MPALLLNIRVDDDERFLLYKRTLLDLVGLFSECHIKVRGRFSSECYQYAESLFGKGIFSYETYSKSDWVAATLMMLTSVRDRSIYLYLEDHKLVVSQLQLEKFLKEFDEDKLDYLCYSFYRASQLGIENLLPLNVRQSENLTVFQLNSHTLRLGGKISPKFCCYSLASVASVEYFRSLLELENKRYKIHNKRLIQLICWLFPYPKYRKFVDSINRILSPLNVRFCLYPVDTPFNLEKMWYEVLPLNREWKFGVPNQELLANFDDDNGAYGESLIKRGLYPFDCKPRSIASMPSINFTILLEEGEEYDLNYFSREGRIRRAPEVSVSVLRGKLEIIYGGSRVSLCEGSKEYFFANLAPRLIGVAIAKVEITVYDDVFE